MKKKGFATSAILYTLLLLFLVLMLGILNNLQNKKTILDALKKDTINALQQDTITDAILDQIALINSKVVEIETRISNYEANTYTKTEIDEMFVNRQLKTKRVLTNEEINDTLDLCTNSDNHEKIVIQLIAVAEHGLSLYGGVWLVETVCTSTDYGYQIAKKYNESLMAPYVKGRSLYGGAWGSWYDV